MEVNSFRFATHSFTLVLLFRSKYPKNKTKRSLIVEEMRISESRVMASVFISYSRQNQDVAKDLVPDIESLGHSVWFDQELSGGQSWWDQILGQIRECEVFVFVLDSESLNSTACKREYGYAADLGIRILPILASENVSTNLLPPALTQIQFVDYREQDRDSFRSLSRAFTKLPSATPLTDPLPPPPEVPLSYLTGVAERIETTSTLSYEEQSVLIADLKKSLRVPETTDDALALLENLRKRPDILANIAEDIDELLGRPRPARAKRKATTSPSSPTKTGKKNVKKQPPPSDMAVLDSTSGGLLGLGTNSITYHGHQIEMKSGIVDKVFYDGREVSSKVVLSFTGKHEFTVSEDGEEIHYLITIVGKMTKIVCEVRRNGKIIFDDR